MAQASPPLSGAYTPHRLLGVEHGHAEGHGAIVIRDGLGGEVSISPGESKAFPVQLDEDGCFFWRCGHQTRLEGVPVIERTRLPWRDTNYLQVTRDPAQGITWGCYERRTARAGYSVEVGRATSPYSPAAPMPASSSPRAAWAVRPGQGTPTVGLAPPFQRFGQMPETVRTANSTPSHRPSVGREGSARGGTPGAAGAARSAGFDGYSPNARSEGGVVGPGADWKVASMEAALALTREFLQYMEEAPRRLSAFCFLGGLALLVNGLLGLLDIFQVFSHVVYYVVHCYGVFFGAVTCVIELHPDSAPNLYESLKDVQLWVHQWAKGLSTLWGRGLFHLFQGTLAVVSSGDLGVGVAIGIYMMMMGSVYIYLHFRPRRRAGQDGYVTIGE